MDVDSKERRRVISSYIAQLSDTAIGVQGQRKNAIYARAKYKLEHQPTMEAMIQQFSGNLYLISAPSGAGKTSLVKALIESLSQVSVCVSHTTRAMRPSEENGSDYHFISQHQFQQMMAEDAFLEYAKVFDNYYGTSRSSVVSSLDQGEDIILEIDWQGAQQIRRQMPQSTSIFILPPSRQTLQQRLTTRGQDSQEVIARRMRDAVLQMSHYEDFDYLIINDDFSQSVTNLKTIFMANRLRMLPQCRHNTELLKNLFS